MTDISELRSYERYHVNEPLTGSFGSSEITLINLSEQGAQVEHAQPLRVATKARFWFKRGTVAASVQALVVWSRLSKQKSADGKLLYRTGLRIEEGAAEFSRVMSELAEGGIIARDAESLERKRKLREEREMAKRVTPSMRVLRHVEEEVPSHQVLLINHARTRLKENPDEAQKWYSRAYFAIRQGQSMAGEMSKYPEDVLAVWEYLERTISLAVIARVFEASS